MKLSIDVEIDVDFNVKSMFELFEGELSGGTAGVCLRACPEKIVLRVTGSRHRYVGTHVEVGIEC